VRARETSGGVTMASSSRRAGDVGQVRGAKLEAVEDMLAILESVINSPRFGISALEGVRKASEGGMPNG